MKNNKRTANIVDHDRLQCKNCNEFRELKYFKCSQVVNKRYYTTKKCKICLGVKINENKYIETHETMKTLQKECLVFLERMKLMKGYVDMLDAYKLAHYYTDFFGYRDVFYEDIEEELTFMLVSLLRQKKKQENEYKTT